MMFAPASLQKHARLEQGQIEYIFDSSQRFEKPSMMLYHLSLSSHPNLSGKVVNVSYRNDKDFPPLQAADLLAWQIRRFFALRTNPSESISMKRETSAAFLRSGMSYPGLDYVASPAT